MNILTMAKVDASTLQNYSLEVIFVFICFVCFIILPKRAVYFSLLSHFTICIANEEQSEEESRNEYVRSSIRKCYLKCKTHTNNEELNEHLNNKSFGNVCDFFHST